MTPVKFGISFNLTAFNQAGALVHVYKDGSVLINHGGTEMGQGLHTKMLQVAATTLGVPLAGSGWLRPVPTRCRTPRRPRPRPAPTSTARRSRTPASRSANGSRRSRAAARHQPARRAVRRRRRPRPVRRRRGVGGTRPRRLPAASAVVGGRLLPHRGTALGRERHARRAVQVLRVRRCRGRGGGGRVHRRLHPAAGRHRARRRATA